MLRKRGQLSPPPFLLSWRMEAGPGPAAGSQLCDKKSLLQHVISSAEDIKSMLKIVTSNTNSFGVSSPQRATVAELN